MPSCPAFQTKGTALCVAFIQPSHIAAQSHLRNWDDLNVVCETSLYMGPSVPRVPGHWSLDLGSSVCNSWMCSFLAAPFICCSGGPEAQLVSLNVPCPASSGVWSCGIEGDVQRWNILQFKGFSCCQEKSVFMLLLWL